MNFVWKIKHKNKDNEELKINVEKEYEILKSLENPFIIKPHEIIYLNEKETFVIIQEYF